MRITTKLQSPAHSGVELSHRRLLLQPLVALSLAIVLWQSAEAANVDGNGQKWSPLTIDLIGPSASESDTSPNPFLDYRLTVTFTAPSGQTYVVPGFFAGDGAGFGSGNHWQARFSANETGVWGYQAQLVSGSNIAISTDSSAGNTIDMNDASGEFTIVAQSASAPGFLKYGRLAYVGEHYLKFQDGPYWIKGGTDSPENFLGYTGIDGTVDQTRTKYLHSYATHRQDAKDDDPVFSNEKTGADSRGITGALNYLSEQGVNSIYFLPMNLGGDGQETFPFVAGAKTRFNKTHYDISKLYQWNQVLQHAQRRAIALNIVLSETEQANERWLDEGKLGLERKLYFRELIARYGYLLAAKWNLGEESDFSVADLRAHASYIQALDWSGKPIAVHTQINNFKDYPAIVGDSRFSASSIQYRPERASEFTEQWRKRSAAAGRPWVIDMDENTDGLTDKNATERRKRTLYDVYFSGGNIEWYFGYHPQPLGGDITASDFRKREAMWKYMRIAREFMEAQLPFWEMAPADALVSGEDGSFGGAEVFAQADVVYAIYLPDASNSNATLDLSGASGNFTKQWFNPISGNFEGNSESVSGGSKVSLGNAPSRRNDDWIVLYRSETNSDSSTTGNDTGSNATAGDATTGSGDTSGGATTGDVTTDGGGTTGGATTGDVAIDSGATTGGATTGDVTTDNADTTGGATTGDVTTDSDDTTGGATTGDVTTDSADTSGGETTGEAMTDSGDTTGDSTSGDGTTTSSTDGTTSNTLPELFIGEIGTAIAGTLYTLPIRATDKDGVAPVLTADTLPPGMTMKTIGDGAVNLVWAVPSNLTGDVQVQMIAIDEQYRAQRVTREFSIPVRAASNEPEIAQPLPDLPPMIFGVEDKIVAVGQSLSLVVIPVDPEGVVADLRLANAPAGATFDDNGDGSRLFSWTPSSDAIGEYQLSFIATDAGAIPHVVRTITSIIVVSADDSRASTGTSISNTSNHAPLFIALPTIQTGIGKSIAIPVQPIDPEGQPPILQILELPKGASFDDNGDGSRTLNWTPDVAQNRVLTFVATDSNDAALSSTLNVSVEVTP